VTLPAVMTPVLHRALSIVVQKFWFRALNPGVGQTPDQGFTLTDDMVVYCCRPALVDACPRNAKKLSWWSDEFGL
jgi:hypothetical protein